MDYILMNGDIPVLSFDLEERYMEVLNNRFLPYELKDYVQSTNPYDYKKAGADMDCLKDFLSSRLLNLSRSNAKVILNVAKLPQTMRMADRLKISIACRALSMEDNFWLKKPEEMLQFSDVNLREIPLSDISYLVSILGKHLTATAKELRPDLSSTGMFPKFWRREDDGVYLWKTDKLTPTQENTKSEIQSSEILTKAGADVLEYFLKEQGGLIFSVSKCMTDNRKSLVSAQSMMDYFTHVGKSFSDYVMENYRRAFANMCVADYVLANTDRHNGNWTFFVNNETNEVESFAPLYDFNQTLMADRFYTQVEELPYEPTGKTMLESAMEMLPFCTLKFELSSLSVECLNRLNQLPAVFQEEQHESR